MVRKPPSFRFLDGKGHALIPSNRLNRILRSQIVRPPLAGRTALDLGSPLSVVVAFARRFTLKRGQLYVHLLEIVLLRTFESAKFCQRVIVRERVVR